MKIITSVNLHARKGLPIERDEVAIDPYQDRNSSPKTPEDDKMLGCDQVRRHIERTEQRRAGEKKLEKSVKLSFSSYPFRLKAEME